MIVAVVQIISGTFYDIWRNVEISDNTTNQITEQGTTPFRLMDNLLKHVKPSPSKPLEQEQTYPSLVSTQVASLLQLCIPLAHSSRSVVAKWSQEENKVLEA